MHQELEKALVRFEASADADTARTLVFQAKRYRDEEPKLSMIKEQLAVFHLGPDATDEPIELMARLVRRTLRH